MARLRLLPAVLFRWRYRFTPAGRTFGVIFIMAALTTAGLGQLRPVHSFFLLLAAFALVDWVVGRLFLPRLSAERKLPARIAAGAEVELQLQVKNLSRHAAYDLGALEWRPPAQIEVVGEPEYLDRLGPGETATLSRRLLARRRGIYDLEAAAVVSAFPFGSYHQVRRFAARHRLLVYPRFHPLSRFEIPTGRRHQPGGLQLVSAVGDSEEFLGTREYRPGDRRRDIDHRAWARRGQPIVREYQQEYLTRIALVLDTHVRGRGRVGRDDFEAAISLGASVADALSRREYVVDVFAAGPDLYHFQAGRSLAYLDDILDVLACLEPCRTSPFETIGPAILELLDRISTAVVILLDWDEERREFVQRIRDDGLSVFAAVVRSGPLAADPTGFVTDSGPVRILTAADVEKGVAEL